MLVYGDAWKSVPVPFPSVTIDLTLATDTATTAATRCGITLTVIYSKIQDAIDSTLSSEKSWPYEWKFVVFTNCNSWSIYLMYQSLIYRLQKSESETTMLRIHIRSLFLFLLFPSIPRLHFINQWNCVPGAKGFC